jgi:hypothetical protein
MKKYLLLFALFLCISAAADSIRTIRDVDIRVEVNRDGSAWITQRWDAEAGSSGTEFYIPVGNLGPMTIGQLQVSENGSEFESLGEKWDVDRDRSFKTRKCGIVPKRDGVELCWGLGEKGWHQWTARFFVTGLVQAYDDADAFNFQFVNRGMNPAPEHARVTIVPAFDCPQWTYDNTRVWAFGFYGDINVADGAVVAETSESMSYDSSLIALVKFEKGMFQPTVVKGGPFQDLLDRALEGSSYGDDDDGKWILMIFGFLFCGGFLFLIWAAVVSALGYKWKKSFFGKRKITEWFRDVPLDGNLLAAHYALTKGKRFEASAPANNLIGAFFLRWIMNGQVNVQPDPKSEKRVNLSFVAESVSQDDVEESLYQMARTASGNNLILEKGEFEKWSTDNYKKMTAWPERAIARGKTWFREKGYLVKDYTLTAAGQVEACHLVEFQNYLKNFTLSDERAAIEVRLWKEYLVYAQLFGIADKVAQQFKKLYPAQFDEVARSTGMDTTTLYYTMRWTNSMSTKAFTNAVTKAGNINGTGGHSSFGGGGGFSGGGFGGGGR